MRLVCALLLLIAADASAGRTHKRSHGNHKKLKPRVAAPAQLPAEESADPAASDEAPPTRAPVEPRSAPPSSPVSPPPALRHPQ